MEIVHARAEDLPEIFKIYEYARKFMRASGNPTQWGNTRPLPETVIKDIEKRQSYLVKENGRICGVFAFIIGNDPTYDIIEDGEWLNSNEYGVIHRLAGNGTCKGVFEAALAYCRSRIADIKVDTHKDNLVMQHLFETHDFVYCGIIYTDDGTARRAYQLLRK